MIQVFYTPQELEALTRMIDLAIKAGGLSIAGDAVHLHQKHIQCVQAAQESAREVEKAVEAANQEEKESHA